MEIKSLPFSQTKNHISVFVSLRKLPAVDLQTQPSNDQQDSEGGCMC